jgi:hypothetical protein
MVKKIIAVIACIGLLVSLTVIAYAQSVGQTSTSILVQNLSTSPANLRVDFYDTGGNNTGYKEKSNLCGECSITFDQRRDSGYPGTDTFQGAAIVSADQPVGAVVQVVRTGGSAGVNSYEAYNGLGAPSKSVKAPLILRGIVSAGKTWNTTMAIQNTNVSASAQVTVTFTPDPNVRLGNADTQTYTIPPGGTWYLDQSTQTTLGTRFFGSASVVSNQDVAVAVTSGTNDGSSLIVYPTFTAGSTTVYLPGAMKNILSQGHNYFTSLTIVNLGSAADPAPVVTIEYQPQSGTVSGPYTVTVQTATTIDMRSDPHITSATFFGAVKLINTTNSTPFAAMLNTRGDNASTGAAVFATTYGGMTAGATTVYVPYLLKYISSAGYNWSTSILIQNLDPASGNLDVTITYKEDPSIGTHTYTSSQTGITTSRTIDLRLDPNITQSTFYGAAKIVSTNGRPFGVVVLVRGSGGAGDALSSYLGISP